MLWAKGKDSGHLWTWALPGLMGSHATPTEVVGLCPLSLASLGLFFLSSMTDVTKAAPGLRVQLSPKQVLCLASCPCHSFLPGRKRIWSSS